MNILLRNVWLEKNIYTYTHLGHEARTQKVSYPMFFLEARWCYNTLQKHEVYGWWNDLMNYFNNCHTVFLKYKHTGSSFIKLSFWTILYFQLMHDVCRYGLREKIKVAQIGNWNTRVFIFQKYGKFWSISLELFVEHKPSNCEEWIGM